jgi:hypothetical protein
MKAGVPSFKLSRRIRRGSVSTMMRDSSDTDRMRRRDRRLQTPNARETKKHHATSVRAIQIAVSSVLDRVPW